MLPRDNQIRKGTAEPRMRKLLRKRPEG